MSDSTIVSQTSDIEITATISDIGPSPTSVSTISDASDDQLHSDTSIVPQKLAIEKTDSEDYDNVRRRSSKYSAGNVIKLAKRYGLVSCIAVIICNVIGAGIFVHPQDVYKKTESTGISLIIWFAMGVHVVIGGLCYSELGTTLPLSGGDYAYLMESFGPFIGFQYQWAANLLFIPAVNAILARTVGRYFLVLVCIYACSGVGETGMGDLLGPSWVQNWYATGIGFVFLMLITAVNCISLKFTERMQNILMFAKLSSCFLIIILGLVQIGSSSEGSGFRSPIDLTTKDTLGHFDRHVYDICAAIYEVSFAYLGWTYLNFITEELEDPYRNLPIGIMISVPVIGVIYTTMNVCYFATLNNEELLATRGIASDTLNNVIGENLKHEFGWVIPVVVMISAVGSLASHMMATSRVTFVGARNNQLPMMFAQIHRKRLTPIPALLFQGFTTTLFLVFQQGVTLILMAVYAENFFSTLAVVGLLYLRHKAPELERPIKLWISVPIWYVVVSIIIFLIPILSLGIDLNEEGDSKIAQVSVVVGPVIVFLTGIPVYYYFIKQPLILLKLSSWLYNPDCQHDANHIIARYIEKPLGLTQVQ